MGTAITGDVGHRKRGEPLGLRLVVGRVDDHQAGFLREQAEGAGHLLLLLGHVRLAQRLARLHRGQHDFQGGVFLLERLVLLPWQGLLELLFHAVDAVRDNLHVGQQEVFVERADVGHRVAAVEGGDDHHQAAGLANHRQPGGVALVRAAQARRIDQFDRRQGDLLGVIDLAELRDARLGDGRHRALAGVGQRGVGGHPAEPMEQRALARPLISDQSDFHPSCLLQAAISSSACSTAWTWVLSRGVPPKRTR